MCCWLGLLFQSCITSSCTLPLVNVPPSTKTNPGAVSCSLNLSLYWKPPSLELIFQPVALDEFFELDLLQLTAVTDTARINNNTTVQKYQLDYARDSAPEEHLEHMLFSSPDGGR